MGLLNEIDVRSFKNIIFERKKNEMIYAGSLYHVADPMYALIG